MRELNIQSFLFGLFFLIICSNKYLALTHSNRQRVNIRLCDSEISQDCGNSMQSDSIHLPCAYLFLSLHFHHVGACLSFDHSETNQSSSKFCYKQYKYPLTNEISTVFAAVSPIYLCIHEGPRPYPESVQISEISQLFPEVFTVIPE